MDESRVACRDRFDMNKQGEGWKPHAGSSEQQICYNPILHKADVYQRGCCGEVERCKAPFRESTRGNAYRRHVSKGRRKGLAEFADLCNPGRGNQNPAHAAALESNHRAFYVRRTDLCPQIKDARGALRAVSGAAAARRQPSAPPQLLAK